MNYINPLRKAHRNPFQESLSESVLESLVGIIAGMRLGTHLGIFVLESFWFFFGISISKIPNLIF